ncbi:hypothetical protein GCM10022200_24030 [Microbacterium awajiense]|uniref:EAL domain-containing protein n=1 Tax=Microbacterium awajiense TaxID=415214 RepID=A0ABP7AU46_9MICO
MSDLGDELRAALNDGQLAVEYQPQFDLHAATPAPGRPVAVEALCRWHHPTRGLVMPDVFIPIAEREHIITALDAHVLLLAAEQVRRWQLDGHRLGLSVNASPTHMSPEYADAVIQALDDFGLSHGSLAIEITESPAPQLLPEAIAILPRLRSEGIAVSLDDFGGGDTTIDMLDSLPIDEIKIDRSITQRTDRAADVEVAAVVAHADRHGWRVVAEGIETEADLERSRRRGCHRGQGFLWGPPVPAARLEEMLAS